MNQHFDYRLSFRIIAVATQNSIEIVEIDIHHRRRPTHADFLDTIPVNTQN